MNKKKFRRSILIFLVLIFFLYLQGITQGTNNRDNHYTLIINIELDKKIYDYSDYGEPPQVAIWLEDLENNEIRTIYVTRRTAENDWYGKTECPVSLPLWQSRKKKNLPDGVSGATEKNFIKRSLQIKKDITFNIFIEVNVAGDYNRNFPANFENGSPDPQGNGQPSIIYRGKIKINKGERTIPEVIGRSMQLDPVKDVISDMKGITSALKVIKKIEVYIK
ncbi:MAG: hypothetical protein ABFR75_01015 [Acidobacteriota bacterium]